MDSWDEEDDDRPTLLGRAMNAAGWLASLPAELLSWWRYPSITIDGEGIHTLDKPRYHRVRIRGGSVYSPGPQARTIRHLELSRGGAFYVDGAASRWHWYAKRFAITKQDLLDG